LLSCSILVAAAPSPALAFRTTETLKLLKALKQKGSVACPPFSDSSAFSVSVIQWGGDGQKDLWPDLPNSDVLLPARVELVDR
jgi:hypothetical protein